MHWNRCAPVLAALCLLSCAEGPETNPEANAGGASASGAGGSVGFTSGAGGGYCGGCSTDLKKVVDGDGNVVKECPADEACACGECTKDVCGAATVAKSTYGCDYWTMNLDAAPQEFNGGCYAAFVANTWTTPVHLAVERAGKTLDPASFVRIPSGKGASMTYAPYDPDAGLPPGEVAIVFLADGSPLFYKMNCPEPAAIDYDTALHGTGKKPAFHLTTDAPVVSYQIYPYGGGRSAITSATLLFPTSAWGDNYLAINAYSASKAAPGFPSLDVVAAEDGTVVTMNPVADVEGGGDVPASPKNTVFTVNLDRGEYFQITQAEELTGSVLLANKPVGFFAGSTALNVPADSVAADTGQQQIPPVRALGHEYVAVRNRERHIDANLTPNPYAPHESGPVRLVGAVDETALSYEPAPPVGAPLALARGEMVEFWAPTDQPFIVRSQDAEHLFYMAEYMTGGYYSVDPQGGMYQYDGEGDAEFVNAVPRDQYLDRYVFFTDPTYPETNLVVIRTKDKAGEFAPVVLDCLGEIGGFSPLGDYEWARVDLQTGDFQDVGACGNGVHVMESKVPFGLTVWGWGSKATGGLDPTKDANYSQYVSYAYPAGMSVRPINEVVVTPEVK